MNTESATAGLSFWLRWTVASIVGWALGVVAIAAFALVYFVFTDTLPNFSIVAAFAGIGALLGFSMGMAQRLVLRQLISWASRWPLASAVGFAVIGVLIVTFNVGLHTAGDIVGFGVMLPLVYGAGSGGVLVLLFRRYVI